MSVKVEVAALGSLSPIVLTVSVNVKQHLKKEEKFTKVFCKFPINYYYC